MARGSATGNGRDTTWKKVMDAIRNPFSCFSSTTTHDPDADALPPPPQDDRPSAPSGTQVDPSISPPATAPQGESLTSPPETALPVEQSTLPPATTLQGKRSTTSDGHRRHESVGRSTTDSRRDQQCLICFEDLLAGGLETGQGVYTGACGHAFHFMCIVSSVEAGARKCPACRLQWKAISLLSRKVIQKMKTEAAKDTSYIVVPRDRSRRSTVALPRVLSPRSASTRPAKGVVIHSQLPSTRHQERAVIPGDPPRKFNDDEPRQEGRAVNQEDPPRKFNDDEPRQEGWAVIREDPPENFNDDEPCQEGQAVVQEALQENFNDDEPLDQEIATTEIPENVDGSRRVGINTHTQMSAVPSSSALNKFTVCLHLKAPGLNSEQNTSAEMLRAPVDLVAVLDISGSMCGTKIALLKKAMKFVIENLGQNDRLSVVSFALAAQRLFPLRRMTDNGKQQALRAINSLESTGGTNIAEGLRKGIKVMEDRKVSNCVTYILLLSDGHDTHTLNYSSFSETEEQLNYKELLPSSTVPEEASGFNISVHTFGFGTDHDSSALHTISQVSGGTFSFIENQEVIQVAFAQCIGGLLSIVAMDLYIRFECVDQEICLGSIEAGNHPNHIFSNQRAGAITVGNMYADEERDFLVSINIPAETLSNQTNLLKVGCVYDDPLTNRQVIVEAGGVRIERTDMEIQENISIEVDRQQNRIQAVDAMALARTAADNGDLEDAATILENARKALSETVSARSQDQLCISLDAELKRMQERMANRHMYETSGRALILSGLSSHSWQRATARGDSHLWSYQTPRMSQLVIRSQSSSSSAQRQSLQDTQSGHTREPTE